MSTSKELTIGQKLVASVRAELAEGREETRTLQELLDGLTLKQQRFVWAYCEHGNGARAIREAGYQVNGIPQQAGTHANENLLNPVIQEATKMILNARMGTGFVMTNFQRLATRADSEMVQLGATDKLAKIAGLYDQDQTKTSSNHLHIHLPSKTSNN
jgi:hypothetical protein